MTVHANTPSWLYYYFLLCDTLSLSQLPQQGDRQCRTVRSVQNLFSLLYLLLFSSTTPCYLLIFFCYSMGHLWAVVPQECPCPAMSCPLTIFPWATLPQHGLPAEAHPLEYWAFCQDCLSGCVHKKNLFLVFLC